MLNIVQTLLRRILNGEKFIDQFIEIVVIRLGKQRLDGFIIGKKLTENGRKFLQQIRAAGFFRETNECLRTVKENFDIPYGRCFQKMNRQSENRNVILVFRHFSDRGGSKAFPIDGKIEI